MYSHFKTPFLSIENYELDKELTNQVPTNLFKEYGFVVLEKYSNMLTVGMCEPTLKEIVHQVLRKLFHAEIHIQIFQVDKKALSEKLDNIEKGQFQIEEVKWEG